MIEAKQSANRFGFLLRILRRGGNECRIREEYHEEGTNVFEVLATLAYLIVFAGLEYKSAVL